MGQDGNKNKKNVLFWKVDIFMVMGGDSLPRRHMYILDAMFGVDEIDLYLPHQ